MLTSETAHWHEVIINESQTNRPDERPAKKTLKQEEKLTLEEKSDPKIRRSVYYLFLI